MCEQYLITLHRQVGKFYLETGSIVEKILKDNPTALDGVPTTQLAAEHSVANARRANREHLNSSTRTISNFQMIKSTPFYNEYLYMSNEDIKSFICTLKKSEQMHIYRNLYAHMAEEERQGCHETYISLVSKRDMFAQKRSALCTQVKEHGGPFSSPAEIVDFVQEFSGLDDELRNIISLEIKFQKIIINDRTVDSNLYKAKRKDYKTGKFIKVPLATMIKNLKAIVMPPPSVVSFPKPNGGEIAFKLQSLHTEMKQNYRHRDAPYLSHTPLLSLHNPFLSLFIKTHTLSLYLCFSLNTHLLSLFLSTHTLYISLHILCLSSQTLSLHSPHTLYIFLFLPPYTLSFSLYTQILSISLHKLSLFISLSHCTHTLYLSLHTNTIYLSFSLHTPSSLSLHTLSIFSIYIHILSLSLHTCCLSISLHTLTLFLSTRKHTLSLCAHSLSLYTQSLFLSTHSLFL